MRVIVILVALVFIPLNSDGQSVWKNKKQKVSYSQGTFFGYWGYNVSAYTKTNIRFVGPGYDFTMAGARAHDFPTRFTFRNYFHPAQLTVPQFVARFGYYIRDHWAVTFGYDHLKYIFQHGNEMLLSGQIDPGVDNVTNLSGTYNSEPITTQETKFHYENTNGLNYIRAELIRTDLLAALGREQQFRISSNLGVGAGPILSFNDFEFAGTKSMETVSLSGYGISGHASLRFEFFKHVFIQTNLNGGFHHQVKVRTRPNDPSSFARHAYGYFSFDTAIGFLLYFRPKNACDSCPTW